MHSVQLGSLVLVIFLQRESSGLTAGNGKTTRLLTLTRDSCVTTVSEGKSLCTESIISFATSSTMIAIIGKGAFMGGDDRVTRLTNWRNPAISGLTSL